MLDYLKDVLGLSAKEKVWADANRLPLYLRSGREYSVLVIDNVELLVIRMEQSTFNLNAFKKQLKKLYEYWSKDIVLCFDRLTTYQRKALIEQRISFIVPGSQIYLPFIGVVLQERVENSKKEVLRLSPSSQQLFLYLLYHNEKNPCSKVEISRELGVSAMSISRAVQELDALDLVKIRKTGRKDYVLLAYSKREILEKVQPYLINPVQKRVFARKQYAFDTLLLSGEAALSEKTMLNPPAVVSKAIYKKDYKKIQDIEKVDPAWCMESDYIELEVWKYDPKPLAIAETVDVVSLIVSLSDNKDERVEMMVEELLEDYKNGWRI